MLLRGHPLFYAFHSQTTVHYSLIHRPHRPPHPLPTAHRPPPTARRPPPSVLHPPLSVLNPLLSTLHPSPALRAPPSVLHSPPSTLCPQSSTLHPTSSIHHPPSTVGTPPPVAVDPQWYGILITVECLTIAAVLYSLRRCPHGYWWQVYDDVFHMASTKHGGAR